MQNSSVKISAILAADNSCYSNDRAAAMEIGGVTTASEFHYMQTKAMLRKMRLTPTRDEIEYHR
jgi:hypothetical protein